MNGQVLVRRPDLNVPGGSGPRVVAGDEHSCSPSRMLLSFERPIGQSGRRLLLVPSAKPLGARSLKTAQFFQCNGYHRVLGLGRVRDHRQDMKGTRWMPRHQESMKGVNGCDKPRVGAE